MSYYIGLQNHFWDKDALYGFKPNEVALYAYLLRTANVARWEVLTIVERDDVLRIKWGIAQEALKAARVRLAGAGLINFTPGNGRGKGTSYELILPGKVQLKQTLSGSKGSAKGAVKSDPLPDSPERKGPGKVQLNPTLSEAEPATGADHGAPKIKILSGTDVPDTPLSAGDGEFRANVEGGIEWLEERAAIVKAGSLYQSCIDSYWTWHIRETATPEQPEGLVPQIGTIGGDSMKGIISHLRSQVTHKAAARQETIDGDEMDTRVLRTWRHVLDHTDLLSEWLKSNIRLQDFRSQLQNILKRVRDELLKRQQQQAAGQDGTTSAGPSGAPAQRTAASNQRRGGSVSGLQGLKRNAGPGPGN